MILVGVSVIKTKKYRPQMWVGWCLLITGFGVLSVMTSSSSVALVVGLPAITSAGLGIVAGVSAFS